jgi:hypothetical protein
MRSLDEGLLIRLPHDDSWRIRHDEHLLIPGACGSGKTGPTEQHLSTLELPTLGDETTIRNIRLPPHTASSPTHNSQRRAR